MKLRTLNTQYAQFQEIQYFPFISCVFVYISGPLDQSEQETTQYTVYKNAFINLFQIFILHKSHTWSHYKLSSP